MVSVIIMFKLNEKLDCKVRLENYGWIFLNNSKLKFYMKLCDNELSKLII